MASRILHLMKERRKAAYGTLTVFLLSFLFVVYTRISNPLTSYQDLESIPSSSATIPDPNASSSPSAVQIVAPTVREEQQDTSSNQIDNLPIREEQREQSSSFDPDPVPSPIQADSPPEIKEEEKEGDDSVEEFDFRWEKCRGPVAADYIPCLDNWKAIRALKSRRHMEHRERHCPKPSLRCLVPLPLGYKVPVPWPKSRDMVRLMVR